MAIYINICVLWSGHPGTKGLRYNRTSPLLPPKKISLKSVQQFGRWNKGTDEITRYFTSRAFSKESKRENGRKTSKSKKRNRIDRTIICCIIWKFGKGFIRNGYKCVVWAFQTSHISSISTRTHCFFLIAVECNGRRRTKTSRQKRHFFSYSSKYFDVHKSWFAISRK